MIGFPIGILYANAMEWVIHKHILHGLGKDKKSFWSFHWHDHHQSARKNQMHDDQYLKPIFSKTFGRDPHSKEVISLVAGALVHAPLLPVAPFFTIAVWASAANYYRVHRKAHLDPKWAEENLPWHVDHHMGMNQHANWCVTFPLWDVVMGTRERYVGTPKHAEDKAREEARLRQQTIDVQPKNDDEARAA